jgi:hypothetical protein
MLASKPHMPTIVAHDESHGFSGIPLRLHLEKNDSQMIDFTSFFPYALVHSAATREYASCAALSSLCSKKKHTCGQNSGIGADHSTKR